MWHHHPLAKNLSCNEYLCTLQILTCSPKGKKTIYFVQCACGKFCYCYISGFTLNLKGAQSRFACFKKFSLNFSNSLFAICVNLRHPWPSLFLYGSLLSLWCFSILVHYYFQVSFHFKEILYVAKTKHHRDCAPLRLVATERLQRTHFSPDNNGQSGHKILWVQPVIKLN